MNFICGQIIINLTKFLFTEATVEYARIKELNLLSEDCNRYVQLLGCRDSTHDCVGHAGISVFKTH